MVPIEIAIYSFQANNLIQHRGSRAVTGDFDCVARGKAWHCVSRALGLKVDDDCSKTNMALRAIGVEGWLAGRGRGLDFVNGVEASFSSDIRMIRV